MIGSPRRVHFYLAFFPRGLFPRPTARHHTLTDALAKRVFSRIQLTAYDAAGQVVQSDDLGAVRWWRGLLIEPPPGYESAFPHPSERRGG